MRSYHRHVETLLSGPKTSGVRKPTFRASAIFPVLQQEGISSRILFMGYWKAKRDIEDLACVLTLRSEKGHLITRHQCKIHDVRSIRFELANLLKEGGMDPKAPFLGTVELEFFSLENLFFPFPAAVVNYYGPNFSTVVHTAQRVFNDYEDLKENTMEVVPESGFNIHCTDDIEPFFAMVNGPEPVPNCRVEMEFFNADGDQLICEHELGDLVPYQTVWLYPSHHCDLKTFLKGKVGAAKVRFQVAWIYPRLIVGNHIHSLNALSITHSYYDCTEAAGSGDYWHKALDRWHPAVLMVPVSLEGQQFTSAYFYPIISPSEVFVDVELYSPEGKWLGEKKDVLRIASPSHELHPIHFAELCEELNISHISHMGARLIARVPDGKRLPARLKLGLDLGESGKGIPCNLCTNLHPFNPSLERKPSCFRWGPLLADQEDCSVWILNSSPLKDYQRSARVNVVFYRELDGKTLTRQYDIPPHGHIILRPSKDPALQDFLNKQIGWYIATSENPYIVSFYFTHHASGVVGGDHGF